MRYRFQQFEQQPDKVANPASGQLNRENEFSLSPVTLKNWSRKTSLAVPSRVSLLILHTQAESQYNRGGLSEAESSLGGGG